MNMSKAIKYLTRRHSSGDILISTYLDALDKLKVMQESENEHERQIAEIEVKMPPKPHEPPKTIITYTSQDGLRIVRPYMERFSVKQRFMLVLLSVLVIGVVMAVVLMK